MTKHSLITNKLIREYTAIQKQNVLSLQESTLKFMIVVLFVGQNVKCYFAMPRYLNILQ